MEINSACAIPTDNRNNIEYLGCNYDPNGIDWLLCAHAGSILRPGITIGERSVIGMGAIVTRDVPPESVVFGNPAHEKYTKEIYSRKKAEWEKE